MRCNKKVIKVQLINCEYLKKILNNLKNAIFFRRHHYETKKQKNKKFV